MEAFREHRKAAGRHVSFTETHIVRMRGDRVREHWLQVGLLGLLTQLTS